jgi:hypothetical protein
MRLRRQAFALALVLVATPAAAGPSPGGRPLQQVLPAAVATPAPVIAIANDRQQDYDIDLIVTMSGRCSTLKIAGRDLACRAVKYFHSRAGRGYFTIAIDDATDNGHIVSFSGENARREGDSLFELTIDQMLLNSKDRPKVDGLRVPLVEPSSGTCRQIGILATGKISKISCVAADKNGRKYELQFDSDDQPVKMQRISQAPLLPEKRRARLRELHECRRKAMTANVMPRDATSYIIQCLEESGHKSADDPQ